MSFWAELQKRKVLRAAIAYVIIAWVIIQVAVTVEEPLGLPAWIDTFAIVLLIAGFPLALILSWFFDLAPDTGNDDPADSAVFKSTAITGGVILFLAILLGAHRFATGQWIFVTPEEAPSISNQELVSTFSGSHTQPSLSPDGKMVAFVSDASGSSQIWVKNLAQGDPVQITHGDSPALHPAWSPKNDQILFHRPGDGIWTVGTLGKPEPRRITEAGRNPGFSADGEFMIFENGASILHARSDGSNQRIVDGVPRRFFTSVWASPALSPDGELIAYFLQSIGPNGDFWVIPSAGGEPRQMTFDMTMAGKPAWSPDGRYILFSSLRRGSKTLWMVPVEGGQPIPVTTGVGQDDDPAVSSAGDKLIFTNARLEHSIVSTDPETGLSTVILSSRTSLRLPRTSPDGKWISYFSETATGIHLFITDITGGKVIQLTRTEGEQNIHPNFSSDSRSVLYYQLLPKQGLRRIPIDGGQSEEIYPDFTWQTHMRVEEDPAGKRISFTRMEPPDWSKDRNLVRDLETGADIRVAEPHMHSPLWTSDGRHLLGYRHNGEIAICPVTGEECEIVTSGGEPVRGGQPRWSSDESRIFFRRPAADPDMREAWVVNRDGTGARKLFEYGPVEPLDHAFEVTPDDQVIWKKFDRGNDEIWMADFE